MLNIFSAAGLDKPDISILSDQFLAEVRGMPQRNLAVELLPASAGFHNPPTSISAARQAMMPE